MKITYAPGVTAPICRDENTTANSLIAAVLHGLENQTSRWADVTHLLTNAQFIIKKVDLRDCVFSLKVNNTSLFLGMIMTGNDGSLDFYINGEYVARSHRPEIIAESILKYIEDAVFLRNFG